MTKLEQVAESQAKFDGRSLAGMPKGERGRYMERARLAIEAMRDLSPAQHEASEEIVVGYDDFACGDGNIYLGLPGYHAKAQHVWSQLIDAALKEPTC